MEITTFGGRVKMFRERAGLTQDELALKLGYSNKSSITKIETGSSSIPPYKIAKFCQVLGCNPEDICNMEESSLVVDAKESSEQFHENVSDILKLEALSKIVSMLPKMNADQMIKAEKILRTLVED